MATAATCVTGSTWKTTAKLSTWLSARVWKREVYNVGGHNEKTNLEIVKLTIATVRRLMEEEPRYRAVLKKQVKAADGTIDISWINEDLITFCQRPPRSRPALCHRPHKDYQCPGLVSGDEVRGRHRQDH